MSANGIEFAPATLERFADYARLFPELGVDDPLPAASDWLARFEKALSTTDISAAQMLFTPECYWRDLVAFTWNIKTQEGRDAIAHMLAWQVPNVKPSNFRLRGEATEADGIVDAWFEFETAVARGLGHVRLRAGERGADQAWTLLTTMAELKGFKRAEWRKAYLLQGQPAATSGN